VTQGDFLKAVIAILEAEGIDYMVVGSFASAAFGEARFTNDIDIVADLDEARALKLCAAFPKDEFYVSDRAALEAVRTRRQFNVIHPASGNKVDFMVARMDPWGRKQLARRQRRNILPDCRAYTASPEDIILAKMIFYREGQSEKHTRDITGMLKISGGQIDQGYISDWSQRLGLEVIWQAILTRMTATDSSAEKP
jgi:hypothetical protein